MFTGLSIASCLAILQPSQSGEAPSFETAASWVEALGVPVASTPEDARVAAARHGGELSYRALERLSRSVPLERVADPIIERLRSASRQRVDELLAVRKRFEEASSGIASITEIVEEAAKAALETSRSPLALGVVNLVNQDGGDQWWRPSDSQVAGCIGAAMVVYFSSEAREEQIARANNAWLEFQVALRRGLNVGQAIDLAKGPTGSTLVNPHTIQWSGAKRPCVTFALDHANEATRIVLELELHAPRADVHGTCSAIHSTNAPGPLYMCPELIDSYAAYARAIDGPWLTRMRWISGQGEAGGSVQLSSSRFGNLSPKEFLERRRSVGPTDADAAITWWGEYNFLRRAVGESLLPGPDHGRNVLDRMGRWLRDDAQLPASLMLLNERLLACGVEESDLEKWTPFVEGAIARWAAESGIGLDNSRKRLDRVTVQAPLAGALMSPAWRDAWRREMQPSLDVVRAEAVAIQTDPDARRWLQSIASAAPGPDLPVIGQVAYEAWNPALLPLTSRIQRFSSLSSRGHRKNASRWIASTARWVGRLEPGRVRSDCENLYSPILERLEAHWFAEIRWIAEQFNGVESTDLGAVCARIDVLGKEAYASPALKAWASFYRGLYLIELADAGLTPGRSGDEKWRRNTRSAVIELTEVTNGDDDRALVVLPGTEPVEARALAHFWKGRAHSRLALYARDEFRQTGHESALMAWTKSVRQFHECRGHLERRYSDALNPETAGSLVTELGRVTPPTPK